MITQYPAPPSNPQARRRRLAFKLTLGRRLGNAVVGELTRRKLRGIRGKCGCSNGSRTCGPAGAGAGQRGMLSGLGSRAFLRDSLRRRRETSAPVGRAPVPGGGARRSGVLRAMNERSFAALRTTPVGGRHGAKTSWARAAGARRGTMRGTGEAATAAENPASRGGWRAFGGVRLCWLRSWTGRCGRRCRRRSGPGPSGRGRRCRRGRRTWLKKCRGF